MSLEESQRKKKLIDTIIYLSILPGLDIMISTEVHPVGLSSPQVFLTNLALNSRIIHVFGLNMVHYIRPLVTQVTTFSALELALCVLEEHSLNGFIKILK